ncbi:DUF2254 domain-containing protein [Nocardioides sp. S-58]|uniref:DUF2254 domain-containing protein n=1 Tax=Nocardioides renjunii TaxID=3095075 RepID=A0ABU5K9X0_9ACTN|nr:MULTISPECIES: DUF2254 domain-containing protein [unclassified Nocardioides]MDZ5661768.1 DUF2254 domain-containing protein [Nocardioides sp. S-58]WQQ24009.1 DUF2254 domain-containing protein [Nocardioides sp. S-34]
MRDSLWLVPLLCLLSGIGLCIATAAIDRAAGTALVPHWVTGGPAAAQSVLSTIVTSLVTLITLVLTVITVAVQLAMAQFSPRIVGALLRDRRSQLTHGLFAATLVYALLAIPQVDDVAAGGDGYMPGLTMLIAYLLMLASIVVLVLYVHHAGQTLRVAGLIDLVGDHLHEELHRVYPADAGAQAAPDPQVVTAPTPGVVVRIDVPGLVDAAAAADCSLQLVPAMGDFVCAGAPLFLVAAGHGARLDPRVAGLVTLGNERSYPDDPAYGFRQLVDIAERGVSSPFDDPTTTVQAIDRLHDALRQLATRTIPTGEHLDHDGIVRLTTPALDWTGYVRLTFDELRLAGASSPQVARRLRAALEDLQTVVPGTRRPELDRQLELLTLGVKKSFESDRDVINALTADQQGLGSGPDLVRDMDRRQDDRSREADMHLRPS